MTFADSLSVLETDDQKPQGPNSLTADSIPSNLVIEQPDLDDENGDPEGDGSESPEPSTKKKTTLGRRKIDINYIQDKNKRQISFSKRKAGIMKKAYELSTLTGTQVLLLVVSETGCVYTFTTPKLQPMVTRPECKSLINSYLVEGTSDTSSTTGSASPSTPQEHPQQQQQQQSQQQQQQQQQQPSPQAQAINSRTVKRRKTVDNIRSSPQPSTEIPAPSVSLMPAHHQLLSNLDPLQHPPHHQSSTHQYGHHQQQQQQQQHHHHHHHQQHPFNSHDPMIRPQPLQEYPPYF